MNNKSPLRYPGGKTRACKVLDGVLNEHFDLSSCTRIASPFFGGGSFEFFLQNKYQKPLVVNDKFKPLINFWTQCQTNKERLCTELKTNLATTKEDFKRYRDAIMTAEPFTQALYYFIINRCSFSGATLSGGFSKLASEKRFTQSSIDRVNNLDLSHVEFHNEDFTSFIEATHVDGTLTFLDPPYYLEKKSKLYGKNGDMHEGFDHEGLHKTLSSKTNWIMTYNTCDYIKKLYKDYKIVNVCWSYGMNKSKDSSEIVIIATAPP